MTRLIYGYMRLSDDLCDESVYRIERTIRMFAVARGSRLAAIYADDQVGFYGAFYALIAEVQRQPGSRDVIVPSLDHLSRHPMLLDQMFQRLTVDARARLWTVCAARAPIDLGTQRA